jgi:hypothetical protein
MASRCAVLEASKSTCAFPGVSQVGERNKCHASRACHEHSVDVDNHVTTPCLGRSTWAPTWGPTLHRISRQCLQSPHTVWQAEASGLCLAHPLPHATVLRCCIAGGSQSRQSRKLWCVTGAAAARISCSTSLSPPHAPPPPAHASPAPPPPAHASTAEVAGARGRKRYAEAKRYSQHRGYSAQQTASVHALGGRDWETCWEPFGKPKSAASSYLLFFQPDSWAAYPFHLSGFAGQAS